ncbi:putative inactive dehydrogenase EasA [Mycena venus]|uniref:Putative inactive dehydrogenase EasA n=1 Tax=Mycena venus TaxID=2733690 RepID=A0A8H6XSE0_9AGAR|nr:putative inactive dehydrogenase EasA [Mycena venus]
MEVNIFRSATLSYVCQFRPRNPAAVDLALTWPSKPISRADIKGTWDKDVLNNIPILDYPLAQSLMSIPKLFQPIQVGDIQLAHRVVFAPATRYRADDNHTPFPHVAEYYGQRASQPGSLIISEATLIAERAGASKHSPGIWSDEQIAAWKKVTENVHAKGSFMYLQLWALGRVFHNYSDPAEANIPYVSASDVPLTGGPTPRALTVDEIQEYIQLYATAASNAVHKAGFDGVEIHSANGYLLDQFLHDQSNIRTDAYGGSIENRARFPLEVVDAVVKAVGQKKTALRVSPWGTVLDMHFADPRPTYAYLFTQLRDRFPDLAYVHVVEPRVDGNQTLSEVKDGHSNDFLREIWGGRPLISAGGYTRATAIAVAEDKGDLVAFARGYIANPDLPYRLIHDIPLAVGDRTLYYVPGSVDPKGYTDYPFAATAVKAQA